MARINVAIFVSGSGTNCENLIKYFKDSALVNTALVVSNKPDAYALVRAKRLGVTTAVTPKADLNNPEVMMPLLEKYDIGIEDVDYATLFRINHASWVLTYHNEHGIMSWLTTRVKK